MALISKLPRKIKNLAVKRRREYVQLNGLDTEMLSTDKLVIAFHWDKTEEGFKYWSDIESNPEYK